MNTRIWHVWINARKEPHERFGATRITVVASDDVDAYNEARQEIESRDFEAGFPISAEPLKAGTP